MVERTEIIKALECCKGGWCIRDGCPLYKAEEDDDIGKCTSELSKNALALIKELAEANATQIVTAIELDKQVERLTEENERLKTATEEAVRSFTRLETLYKIECKRADTIKADTVREMQERIKKNLAESYGTLPHTNCFYAVIDRIANEILNKTEEEKK